MPTNSITANKYVRLLNIYNESTYNYMATTHYIRPRDRPFIVLT